MPIIPTLPSGPTSPPFTIDSIVPCVLSKVENRTNAVDDARGWLRDAIIEISSNGDYRDDFVELEVLGPQFNLVQGQQEYNESLFMPSGDINTATLDIRLWIDPPQNTQWQKMQPTHYQRSDEASVGQSQPNRWYRFGGTIGFYPIPAQTFQVQARALRFHPINYASLGDTVILLPQDWNEVLCYAAAERGFIQYEQYEKSSQIHTLLYGDPTIPNRPGLTAGRVKKRANEQWRQQQVLRPVIRRLSYGGL